MARSGGCGCLCAAAAAAALCLSACGSQPLDRRLPAAPRGIEVASPSIIQGRFSKDVTCAGAGKSPAVRWRRVPPRAAELAVVVVDLQGERGQALHWVVFGIDPRTRQLAPGATPADVREGVTSFGRTSYEPLCPPKDGPAHRYAIEVYALRDATDLADGASVHAVLAQLDRLAVRGGDIQATYKNAQ